MARLDERTFKNVYKFHFFTNRCYYKIYGMGNFIKLADNWLSGCTCVVGAKSRKMGLFWEYFMRGPVRSGWSA